MTLLTTAQREICRQEFTNSNSLRELIIAIDKPENTVVIDVADVFHNEFFPAFVALVPELQRDALTTAQLGQSCLYPKQLHRLYGVQIVNLS